MDLFLLLHHALTFCRLRHGNQMDRDGLPHAEHCIRVAQSLPTPELKIIGLLHDTLEDTETTSEELHALFGERVTQAVCALTHTKGESYESYITRVLQNPDARQVKIVDILDNVRRSNLSSERKKQSYSVALVRLIGMRPELAVGQGFEPWNPFQGYTLSKRAP